VFYSELVGWEYETDEAGYVSIRNAGSVNGGMREQTEPERESSPAWLPYFTVEDADETAMRAEQMGGRVLPGNAGTRFGRVAMIADAQGAVFAAFEGETDA
jgi:predicted enzyme related to lactoylglutathione lyase